MAWGALSAGKGIKALEDTLKEIAQSVRRTVRVAIRGRRLVSQRHTIQPYGGFVY